MGDRELQGGESAGIKADQVPPSVITSYGMSITGGNQTTPPAETPRPLAPPAAPIFGSHIGEAIRILKGDPKPRA